MVILKKNCLLFVLIILLGGCSKEFSPEKNKKYFVGFSQCVSNDLWRQSMNYEMKLEASLHPEIKLLILDGQSNNQKQINDISYLIDQQVDLLIVSPNEAEPLTPIVEKAYKSGIPVILLDRKINSDSYNTYIGADNYKIGYLAGSYALNLIKPNGKILEICGLSGSSPARERKAGFADAIRTGDNLELINCKHNNWAVIDQEKFNTLISNAIKKHPDIDLVFAHNDAIAIHAYNILNELKLSQNIKFIGIDALPGDGGGIQMVMDNKLDASILYPTGGDVAIQTAFKILIGDTVDKNISLESILVDSTNAKLLQIKSDQIHNIRSKIETQNQILNSLFIQYNSQRNFIFTLVTAIFLLAAFLFLLFRSLQINKMMNRKLNEKNLAIEEHLIELEKQRDELYQMQETVKKANEFKIQFFTNISHEFRTPLTLILGTLDQLKNLNIKDNYITKQLNILNKNAERLLKLINELMDFRKIEAQKVSLNIDEHDIVSFLKDIFNYFESSAEIKNINLNFYAQHEQMNVFIDAIKFEKVVFNLLSNAFKFTPDNGEITLSVIYSDCVKDNSKCIEISVKDTGIGIPENELELVFEQFHNFDQNGYSSIASTGIGLAFSKRIVTLHHGNISVKSEVNKGSTFTIQLPTNAAAYKNNEIRNDLTALNSFEHLVSEEFEYLPEQTVNQINVIDDNAEVLLVVEDNKDVVQMLKDNFVKDFVIIAAYNGKEGLALAKKYKPNIIISDIMMPIMDGNEMTRLLKSDIDTSHIPIILLSARTTEENKIEGLECGADYYITKPFNFKILELKLKNIIKNREKIKEHFSKDILFFKNEPRIKDLDKEFLQKVIAQAEIHILDSNLSVENLGKTFGMNRLTFYRKIKTITGLAPSEFIKTIQLHKASDLLKNSDLTISEIAFKVGFETPSYFTKCFKNAFKVKPSDYQKNFNN